MDSRAVLDAMSLRLLLAVLVGWFDRRQQDAVAYLIEENRSVPVRARLSEAGIRVVQMLYQAPTRERNHQGLNNALIDDRTHGSTGKWFRRRPRLGGLLNYYERAA
jgi:hypothetical protein